MNYQAPKIEWIDQKKLDENKVETEDWHQSIAETLIHSYKVLDSMTQDKKIMVHYYNKQTQKGEPYISCPNFNDVSEAKEWVEQIHYPGSLQKAGFKPVGQEVLQEQHSDWVSVDEYLKIAKANERVFIYDTVFKAVFPSRVRIIDGKAGFQLTNGLYAMRVSHVCVMMFPQPPSEVQDEY